MRIRTFGRLRRLVAKGRLGQAACRYLVVFLAAACWSCAASVLFAAMGELELRAIDQSSGKPVSVRMHLWNAKSVSRKVRSQPSFDDHFVFHGRVILRLPPGQYRFRMERGLEYLQQTGNFLIRSGARDNKAVEMRRFVTMSELGWSSGDLLVRRRRKDLLAWASGEDLQFLGAAGGEPGEEGPASGVEPVSSSLPLILAPPLIDAQSGQLALYNVSSLPGIHSTPDDPASGGLLLRRARQEPDVFCLATEICARDLPMWVASERLDGVVVMSPRVVQRGTQSKTGEIVARDESLFPGERGLARFREHVFYQLLESGVRVSPLAISRSGETSVPAGSIRTYAWTGKSTPVVSESSWWDAVRNGQVLLTGGPLLIAQANDRMPGFVFAPAAESEFELSFSATLHTREKISYLEIIKNGKVAHTILLNDWVAENGKLPSLRFEESGWAVLRAVIDDANDYRYAMSGPFFVEFDHQPRISRQAVTFFQSWAEQRWNEVEKIGGAVVAFHRASKRFWTNRHEMANAD